MLGGQARVAVAGSGPMRMLPRPYWLALALLASSCADASSAPADLTRACEQLTREVGASSAELRDCEQRLSDYDDDAASYGCAGVYSDWVSCVAIVGVECDEVALDSSSRSKRAAPMHSC